MGISVELHGSSIQRWRRYLAVIALFAAIASLANGQLAPTGDHYAGRPTDTGYGGTAVDAAGNLPTNIPLDLPPARGGISVPLQIAYGPHRVGAVGLGWDIPLSYLQQTSTLAHRRPASAADVLPTPRVRTTLSLLGESADLVQQGDIWVARVGTLELIVRQGGSSWFAYDGQGRIYTFESPAGLANRGLWLLKSISAAGNTNVLLTYMVASSPVDGGSGTSIDLARITYNTHSSNGAPEEGCAKNEISLSYGNTTLSPISMSVLDGGVLVREDTLTKIDVLSRADCRASLQSLRNYTFHYLPDADTGLPQLDQVNVYGRQGTPEEAIAIPVGTYKYGSATSNGVLRYATTQIIDLPTGINNDEVSGTALDSSVNAPESGDGYAMWQTLIDVTGDGRADLVFRKDDKLWVAKGQAGSGGSTTFGVGPQALVPLSDTTLTSGALATQSMSSRRFSYGPANRNTEDVWRKAIDVNGDGRIDIVDAAEEAGHWVVYLNTPGGPSGVTWQRRSYSIEGLLRTLRDKYHHTISGDHLPLSRRSTATSLEQDQCWKWDGTKWNPCSGFQGAISAYGAEVTYLEWDFTDLNGDGYPDFVFDSTPVDFQLIPPSLPRPYIGQVARYSKVWESFSPQQSSNDVLASFNVLGVRFDSDRDVFAQPVSLQINSPNLGISEWTCTSGSYTTPCSKTPGSERQSAGLADINGDGLLDRVVNLQAYLGTYSGLGQYFSTVYITLPGPLATQYSTHDQVCQTFGSSHPPSTATQAQGLRDLTGDGIPDYYDYTPGTGLAPRVWVGTGAGFRPPIPIVSSVDFQFSHVTESCDGKTSLTDGGLYDIDGDGKPEVVGLNGNTFVVSQLVGGRVTGMPESGRLTSVTNATGAATSITYVSAKQFEDSPLPFPEIVVDSTAVVGTHNLGGTIAGVTHAYSNGSLLFNSALDRFVFPGYERQVTLQLLGQGGALSAGSSKEGLGVATITHAWGLAPFSIGMTKQQRWLREQVVGHVRDVLNLQSVNDPDPWSLLDVQASDSRVIGQTSFEWDAKIFETPPSPPPNPIDCFDIVAPLDFQQTIASLTSDAVDVCRAHGFTFQTITTRWHGDAGPPSDKNVQTGTEALSVDDFGRPIITQYQNDLFRSDDDYCVENTFATPTVQYPRVLTALSSRRVYLCGKNNSNETLASDSWTFDNLSTGLVSDGRIASHSSGRRATDTGALLNTVHLYDATYNLDGNIATLSTKRGSDTRTVAFNYDAFGIVPTQTSINATGVAPQSLAISYDPISLLPLTATDSNQVQRGIDYDGFGRPVRSSATLPGGSLGVLLTAEYSGFDGSDPMGASIRVTRFQEPVDPAALSATVGRKATRYFDELGRPRRTEVALGSSYNNDTLVVDSTIYDAAGRLAFAADPYPSTENLTNAYGLSYFYKPNGDIDCVVHGYGHANAVAPVTDVSAERFPTCFQRSYAGHVDTLDVLDASSLQSNSPQSGVVRRTIRTAIGRAIERSTLRAGLRLEDATFKYDQLGQWIAMTRFLDPATQTEGVNWSVGMDSFGQVRQLTEPANATRSYTYSDWGEPVETDWLDGGTNHALFRTFDSLSRITSKEEHNNGIVDHATVATFTYDLPVSASPLVTPTFVLGHLAGASTATGTADFSYDAFGRTNASTYTDAQGTTYSETEDYHADGNLALLTFYLPDDNYLPESIRYGYDSAGRLRNIKDLETQGSEIYSATGIDVFGRVRSAKYGETDFRADYAAVGRRLIKEGAIRTPSGSRDLIFNSFDPMDRELSRDETSAGAAPGRHTALSYDMLGRLATESESGGAAPSVWKFGYDPLGNIRSLANTVVASDANLTYQTIDRDRICRIGFGNQVANSGGLGGRRPPSVFRCNVVHDGSGNIVNEPTRTETRQLSYLLSGNVSTITQGQKQAHFTYDAFDQLQSLDIQSGGQSTRHDQYYGGLIERHDTVTPTGIVPVVTRNIPGPGGGLVASIRGPMGDQIYEFGEIRGNRYFTNRDGAIVQQVGYQPFGEAQSTGAAPGTTDYSNSQWNDGDDLAEFGLSHLGARVYDPVIGRFLSRDPLLIPRSASSSNPYAFSVNDPWNASDPSGLDCIGDECQGSIPVDPDLADAGGGRDYWLEIGRYQGQAPPPGLILSAPSLSTGPQTQAGAQLQTQVFNELGYAPANFNFDTLAAYHFTLAETLDRINNYESVERDAHIDAYNASLDRISNRAREVGFAMFVIGSGGYALAEVGTAVLMSQGMTGTAAFIGGSSAAGVGGAGVAATTLTAGGASGAAGTQLEADIEEIEADAESSSVLEPYRRPSYSVTAAQRASVQGKPCVTCNDIGQQNVADHKEPLVIQYYRTGTIDLQKMRSLGAVQPQCFDCSNEQGGSLSGFAKAMRDLLERYYGP